MHIAHCILHAHCTDSPVVADVFDLGVEMDELGLEESFLSKLARSLF